MAGRFLTKFHRRCHPLFSSSHHLLRPYAAPLVHGESRSLETLAYEEIRVSERPISSTAFVLHGLLGSARNWRSFSRNLASELQKSSPSNDWSMVLVDMRNHGKSVGIRGLDPPHDITNAARDLANLVKHREWKWPDVIIGHSMGGKVALDFAASCTRGDYGESAISPKQHLKMAITTHATRDLANLVKHLEWKWPDVIIGHSMGGKVALDFAASCTHGDYGESAISPKQLWVLDSNPGIVCSDESNGDVERVLQTLSRLPSSLPSRRWVVDHLNGLGFSKPFSEWIGSNLKKSGDDDGVKWTFDLDAAIAMFSSYREMSYWELLENPPRGMEIELVRAENSGRWGNHEALERLIHLSEKGWGGSVGKVRLHVLPKSGHWVHVDNPKGLLQIMVPNFIS